MNKNHSKSSIHTTLFTIALAALISAGCSRERTDSHASHDHDHDSTHGHSHDDENHAHGEDADHPDGGKSEGGPNGGRLITSVDPAIEFIVEDDRSIRILFLDAERNIVSPSTQAISLVGGERTNPTTLAFLPNGNGLLSDKPVPEGTMVPVVLQIKPSPSADTVREKFNVNLSECPTCDYQEYACVCGHDEH